MLGIKTGFTGNAGYCFCGAARRNGITLISSVLACGWPPNKGYTQTQITPKTPLPNISVSDGKEANVAIKRTSTESFNMLMSSDDIITVSYELPKKLSAPVRSGDIIGYEKYAINDGLYAPSV